MIEDNVIKIYNAERVNFNSRLKMRRETVLSEKLALGYGA